MDRLGGFIADELVRVKTELKRERLKRRQAQRSRDVWKARAQERQRRLEYRSRARAA